MGVVLGLDLGTSYIKAAVVSREGKLLGLGRTRFPVTTPSPGRAEVEIAAFIDVVVETVSEALDAARCETAEIVGVSYSSQANTFALFDSQLAPLTPLVVWTDVRADEHDAQLDAVAQDPEFLTTTGLGAFGKRMTVAKLNWFRRHRAKTWERTRYVLSISDFVAFLLTGQTAGDSSTASLLGIWDVVNARYWEKALLALRLDRSLFATARRPSTIIGATTHTLATRLGLPETAVVSAGSLDHAAAAVGAGIGRLADASESTGTVLAALGLIDHFGVETGMSTGPFAVDGLFYKLAFNDDGAGPLEAYQKAFAPGLTLAELGDLAASVPPGANGATGTLDLEEIGDSPSRNLNRAYDHGTVVRAIMEQVAFSLDGLVRSALDGRKPRAIVATGGGARSDVWLQIKANVLGCDVIRTDCEEPGAFGAAVYAAVGCGWFGSVFDAQSAWLSETARFRPTTDTVEAYRKIRAEIAPQNPQ
ncbi:MAG: hypothetical protein EA426_14090 [Spirochaetaceae bacterium]|nr:MAG: hypothetical protein EA426_14090 [Spirochaetaceae bacterium]